MCGIAGKLFFDEQKHVNASDIKRMTDAIAHRGPDDEGRYLDRNLGLGHRRLSIIDLSERGHQPMSDEKGELWLTFNGEIYNFQELRRQLQQEGVSFRSDTDSEVILYLYRKHGYECVKKLRGMFAFAIWDKRDRSLFLARDRVGQKPLKYYLDDSLFCFASELKAILTQPEVKRRVDWEALDGYLSYLYVPHPKTGFENIYKLEPGHFMIVKKGRVTNRRYWDLSYEPKNEVGEQEAKELVSDALRNAVRMRLMSDVPLGAHLSGGVDSSLVVAMMAQEMSEPVKTFAIGFEENKYNELPFARRVANKYQTDHHEIIVRPDAVKLLPTLVGQYEEPFADPASLPTWYLSEMTRKHVIVALNGDGGDEVFAGYSRYASMIKYMRARRALTLLPFKNSAAEISRLLWRVSGKSSFRHLWRGFVAYSNDPAKFYYNVCGYLGQSVKDSTYDENLKRALKDSRSHLPFLDSYNNASGLTLTDRLISVDSQQYLPDDLLVKVDIASMAHSLEVRSPFLDHVLMELVAKMPSGIKIHRGDQKYILKQIAYDYFPREWIDRPKQGFTLPIEQWFRGELSSYLKAQLLDPAFLQRGFSNSGISRLISEHENYRAIHTYPLWALLQLSHWFNRWFA